MMAVALSGVVAPLDANFPGLQVVPEAPADSAPPERSVVADLVEGAAGGDSSAWDALVDRFASTVWAIARGHRLSAADAADVSQTTWLRLVENLHRIQQPERVGAWLAITARRESLRVLRLGSRQTPTGNDFGTLPDSRPIQPPEHAIVAEQSATLIAELIEQLPSRSQQLLRLLSADAPLSYLDISEALRMPIGSIGPTRARALEQLRRLAIQAGVKPEDVFG